VRSLSIVHAKGAEYLASLRAAEGTMTGSMPSSIQELTPRVFRVHSEGDRVDSKLVALSLIHGVGRVCE